MFVGELAGVAHHEEAPGLEDDAQRPDALALVANEHVPGGAQ